MGAGRHVTFVVSHAVLAVPVHELVQEKYMHMKIQNKGCPNSVFANLSSSFQENAQIILCL